eukprot:888855_1
MSQTMNNKKTNKQKKTRNRKPVAPSFSLPPRGDHCINWLPIAKRELIGRISKNSEYRLNVVQISIKNTTKVVLNKLNELNLLIDNNNEFKLNFNDIITRLIYNWNNKLLVNWKGPKLKTSEWKNKLWEGKNGYFKLCKNWADQNAWKVSHVFWINIYESILQYIRKK